MIATTHLAVGATTGLWCGRLVGRLVGFESELLQIAAALVVGTVSHIVLDAIPHNDAIYATSRKPAILAIELAIIFSVIFWVASFRNLNFLIIFSGMVGAAWLDCFRDSMPYGNVFFGPVVEFFHRFHSQAKPGPIPSLSIQILIAIVALSFLF